jgi:hypothetical protein
MRCGSKNLGCRNRKSGKAAWHAGSGQAARRAGYTASMIGYRTSRRVCGADRTGCRTIRIGFRKSKKCCRTSAKSKLMTSLCEGLQESDVCQFGGFPQSKKLPDFYLQISVDFFDDKSNKSNAHTAEGGISNRTSRIGYRTRRI